jgi:glycosyltransferase involved in cell wall biosynthesis
MRSDVTRVVLFNGNYGQHMAILAGFEAARGEIMVTLDADLQNPPEEIGNLVMKVRVAMTTSAGCDASGRTSLGVPMPPLARSNSPTFGQVKFPRQDSPDCSPCSRRRPCQSCLTSTDVKRVSREAASFNR